MSNECLIEAWQKQYWHQILSAFSQHNLAHAILLSGVEGLGKYAFAKHLVCRLHCLNPLDNFYCGRCRPCQAIAQAQYPDHLEITLEESAKALSIDQMRSVNEFLSQTPHDGQRQTVIIRHADKMNHSAANALLKTLEEPMGESYLLLLDDQHQMLLPTIYSRLQVYDFNRTVSMSDFEALERMHNKPALLIQGLLAGGPGKADDLSLRAELRDMLLDDLLAVLGQKVDMASLVARWLKQDLVLLADIWLGILSDLLKVHGHFSKEFLMHGDCQNQLTSLAQALDERFVMDMHMYLLAFKASLISSCNLNQETLLHQIFWRWHSA